MADLSAVFKKKIAGVPTWAWLGIIVAGVGVGLYIRNRTAAEPMVDEAEDSEGEEAYADVLPYEELPSEDLGYYPMTGGGPPSVYGGGAIRLDPGVLRIKIIRKSKKGKRDKDDKKKRHPDFEGGPDKNGKKRRTLAGTRTAQQRRSMDRGMA